MTPITQNDERDPQTYAVIGAAMEVHRTLGHGFLEAVYQEALAVEFIARSLPFRREAPFDIVYRGETLPVTYKADFLCFDSIIVELKALATLSDKDEARRGSGPTPDVSRLESRDRRSLHVCELTDAEMKAIEEAEIPAEAAAFDHEVTQS